MLFHLVPEDIFQSPAMQRRPCYIWRHPSPQHENIQRHGIFNEAFHPMLMASRCQRRPDAGDSDCCRQQTAKCGQKQCMKKQGCGRKMEERTKPQKMDEKKIATFDFRGFAPEQIKVKVTDKAVLIRGVRKDCHSSIQITKSLPLPQGADKTGVQCQYVDGHVMIQIPPTEKSRLKEKAERKEEPAESPAMKKDDTRDSVGDQSDVTDTERERQAEFEKSMKTLTGLFSTIFGIPFDCDQVEEVKKSVDKEETEKGDLGTSDPEATNDTQTHTDGCVGDAVPKDVTQCDQRDAEETCLMLKYDEKLRLKDGDEDFVKVENQDVDDSLQSEQMENTELEDDETESVTTEAQGDDTEMPDQEGIHSLSNNTNEENTEAVERDEEFKVQLDLSNYKPENIRVVFRDGDVIVEAEREIQAENHTEVEKLSRRIRLPEKADESRLKSVLDDGGVLTIKAPFRSDEENEWKVINVVHENC